MIYNHNFKFVSLLYLLTFRVLLLMRNRIITFKPIVIVNYFALNFKNIHNYLVIKVTSILAFFSSKKLMY